jgi:hypothetical protein
MADITQLPIDELLDDLGDTYADIERCKNALREGAQVYSGGSVKDRLRVNEEIRDMIRAEIKRRCSVEKNKTPMA